MSNELSSLYIAALGLGGDTVWTSGPGMSPGKGVRRTQLYLTLSFTLYEHEALQDSMTQEGSLVCLDW